MTGVAWVTGAGKGIGRHVALELARRGWQVAVSARTVSDLDQVVAETANFPGHAAAYAADITDAAAMAELTKSIESELGAIDLAILNAGTYIRFGAVDFTAEAFAEQININVMGTVNCLAPVMRRMRERRRGHIAVVSSLSGYRGLPLASAYGASKAALTNMCEALKPELEAFDIGITVVHPGFVRTPLTDLNQFPMPFLMEPDVAAQRIVQGIMRGRFEIAMPTRFALLMKLVRCLPYAAYFFISRRMLKE
jgi:NAD(P)-dependent dehydrogenase (short-subunit alcohol dehydrogenase family)